MLFKFDIIIIRKIWRLIMVKGISELYMVANAIKPVVNYANYWGHIFSSLEKNDGSKLSEIAKRITFVGLHLFAGALLFTRNHSLTSVLLILAYLSDDMQKHSLVDNSSDLEESFSPESYKKDLSEENSLPNQSGKESPINEPQPLANNSSDPLEQPLHESPQQNSLSGQSGEEPPINQPQPLLQEEMPIKSNSEDDEAVFDDAWAKAKTETKDELIEDLYGAPNSDELEPVWKEAVLEEAYQESQDLYNPPLDSVNWDELMSLDLYGDNSPKPVLPPSKQAKPITVETNKALNRLKNLVGFKL